MQKLRKLFPLAGALLALAFVSCGSDSDSDSKTAGSISYATTSVSKTTADEAFTNTLTKTGDGTVSYASSKTDVAEVNTQNGLVTIKGAGETTITATVADSESYTYATKTASYTLTVTQASPLNLKTGSEINSILRSLCKDEWGYSACTKFARSETNNDEATEYLDIDEKIPVWLDGTVVYYYVPNGTTVYMNEDSSKMFSDCMKLTSLEVTGFDTSKVENMSGMFNYCHDLTSLDVTGFDTSNVTNMSEMFYYCSKLTELDVSKFDTSKVENMSGMFAYCYGLTSLDVSKFVTSNVTNMSRMFGGCSELTGLDVSKFDTSKVENMSGMFAGCSGLTSLEVTGFDTSNVTNMGSMFSNCSGLTSLDVSKFDTSKVTDMSSMFSRCSGLTSLDVTGFDTSNVTSMSGMFSYCSGLTILDLSNFDTSKVSNMWGMFSYCEGLTKIYASDKFVTTSIPDDDINTKYMCFFFCKKLVGGAGTTFDASNNDQALAVPYARIDGGTDAPGYFTLKLIGNKSKPDAVGDIVFNDGSATPYTADLTLTAEQKAAAIALIFYKGTGLNSGDDTTTSRTLGVGLKHTGLAWCQDSAAAYSKNITTIQCPPSGDDGALTFTGDRDGSDNLEQIEAFDGVDDTATEANYYPAFYFAKNYGTTAANLGDSYKDGWYFPSIAELFQIYACRADTENGFDIDAASSLCGGDQFDTGFYWSSSQFKHSQNAAYTFTFSNGGWNAADKKYDHYYVCAVRAFN